MIEAGERILDGISNDEMPEYTFSWISITLNVMTLLKHHFSQYAENIPGTAYKIQCFLLGMLI